MGLRFLAGDAGNLVRDGRLCRSLAASVLVIIRSGAPLLIGTEVKKGPARERGDELSRVLVPRGTENLFRRTTFENLARMQNGDPMTKCGDR